MAKVLESLVTEQVKEYQVSNSILSVYQSVFRRNHSSTSAAMTVINAIIYNKQFCLSLFIAFSKAFDTVDYSTLIGHFKAIVFSEQAVGGFENSGCSIRGCWF